MDICIERERSKVARWVAKWWPKSRESLLDAEMVLIRAVYNSDSGGAGGQNITEVLDWFAAKRARMTHEGGKGRPLRTISLVIPVMITISARR